MHPLFRNPLFLLLRQFWWLFVVVIALICAIGGEQGLAVAGYFLLSVLALLTGIIASALVHGYWKISQTSLRRQDNKDRFLCPRCLHIESFRYACNSCENEVESFAALTDGAYVNSCPNCQAHLFARHKDAPNNISAYCENCFGLSPLDPFHERSVAITATIFATDFLTLRDTAQAQSQIAKDQTEYFCLDDGKQLRYFLICSEGQMNDQFDQPPAFWQIDSVWIDTTNTEPLHFARAMDAFIRKLGSDTAIRNRIAIRVRQTELDPLIKTRLEAQFKTIKYGIEPDKILIGENVSALNQSTQHQSALAASANDGAIAIPQDISKELVTSTSHQPQTSQD